MNEENGEVKRQRRISVRAKRRLKWLESLAEWEFSPDRSVGIFGLDVLMLREEFPDGIPPEFLDDLSRLVRSGRIKVRMVQMWVFDRGPLDWDSYGEYLRSDEWQAKRLAALDRAGHRCQVCNSAESALNVHHRTYENVGDEQPGALLVLCRDCHRLFHENGRLAR